MPITTSAKKALRGSAQKRVFNLRTKNLVKDTEKKFKKLLSDKNKKEALAFFSQVQKVFDKAAKTNFIKKNTASRKKSRLAALMKKTFA